VNVIGLQDTNKCL